MAFSMLSEITAYYSIDKYIGDNAFFCLGRGWGGGGGVPTVFVSQLVLVDQICLIAVLFGLAKRTCVDVLLSEITKTFRSVSLTLHCEMFSDILNIY